jgi:hypothetical protein
MTRAASKHKRGHRDVKLGKRQAQRRSVAKMKRADNDRNLVGHGGGSISSVHQDKLEERVGFGEADNRSAPQAHVLFDRHAVKVNRH